MDPRRRHELTRYGAPTAFLAAVTIAVLLIKAGLDHGSPSQPTTSAAVSTHMATATGRTTTKLVLTAPIATATATTPTTTTIAGAQYYLIKSGDTLGGIAAQYHTTVEELMRLNPQLDPTALRPGTQIRVS